MHATEESVSIPSYTPKQLSGALDRFESFQVTPCIGTEFRNVNLAELITSADSDAVLKDLAITVSQRGVVFFRAQNDMTGELQKEMTQRMGLLSGKPKNHGLSIHPLHLIRKDDPGLQKIDTARQQQTHGLDTSATRQNHAKEWHTDGSYEVCPPDFGCLRMTEVPPTGGDTLWASSYELYDRLSPPFQSFFESLTASHEVSAFRKAAEDTPGVYFGPRGAPENIDMLFKQSHPLVRTHPVTGWKALYYNGVYGRGIDEVSEMESQDIVTKILRLVADNHDLQVRFRWDNTNDLAIWDNRATMHCATSDLSGLEPRTGWRALSTAEKPFLDPRSLSRTQARKAAVATKNGVEK